MSEKNWMISRRNLLASALAGVSAGAANLLQRNPLFAAAERHALPKGVVPVVTPNGSSLPWR